MLLDLTHFLALYYIYMVMVDFRAWRLWEFDVVWLPVLWALIELSYNWCFDLTSKAWRGWTWSPLLPCFKVRVAWPLPVVKYNPLERKTRVLFVRVSVWIITCEFKHSYCMCVQVCTCTRVLKVFLRTGLCMRTRLPISLETSCLRGARVDEC